MNSLDRSSSIVARSLGFILRQLLMNSRICGECFFHSGCVQLSSERTYAAVISCSSLMIRMYKMRPRDQTSEAAVASLPCSLISGATKNDLPYIDYSF